MALLLPSAYANEVSETLTVDGTDYSGAFRVSPDGRLMGVGNTLIDLTTTTATTAAIVALPDAEDYDIAFELNGVSNTGVMVGSVGVGSYLNYAAVVRDGVMELLPLPAACETGWSQAAAVTADGRRLGGMYAIGIQWYPIFWDWSDAEGCYVQDPATAKPAELPYGSQQGFLARGMNLDADELCGYIIMDNWGQRHPAIYRLSDNKVDLLDFYDITWGLLTQFTGDGQGNWEDYYYPIYNGYIVDYSDRVNGAFHNYDASGRAYGFFLDIFDATPLEPVVDMTRLPEGNSATLEYRSVYYDPTVGGKTYLSDKILQCSYGFDPDHFFASNGWYVKNGSAKAIKAELRLNTTFDVYAVEGMSADGKILTGVDAVFNPALGIYEQAGMYITLDNPLDDSIIQTVELKGSATGELHPAMPNCWYGDIEVADESGFYLSTKSPEGTRMWGTDGSTVAIDGTAMAMADGTKRWKLAAGSYRIDANFATGQLKIRGHGMSGISTIVSDSDNVGITTNGGRITVVGDNAASAVAYTMSGIVAGRGQSIAVAPGIYIVSVGTTCKKVIVR